MSAEFDLVDIWCTRTQQLHVSLGDSDPDTKIWEKLFRQNMIVCMIASHKVRTFVLGQRGTNSAREINIF